MLKYHVNEQGLKSTLEKMNWHSLIKKTRRVNQIILKSAGINTSVSVCLFVVVVVVVVVVVADGLLCTRFRQ